MPEVMFTTSELCELTNIHPDVMSRWTEKGLATSLEASEYYGEGYWSLEDVIFFAKAANYIATFTLLKEYSNNDNYLNDLDELLNDILERETLKLPSHYSDRQKGEEVE